jgi:hypothetical protein
MVLKFKLSEEKKTEIGFIAFNHGNEHMTTLSISEYYLSRVGSAK